MKKILLFILLFMNITNIKAYENEYFSIEIPENYKENIIENNTYKWINDNKYISITINDNKELQYDIESYTEEDIENQKNYIETNINSNLTDYNFQVNVTNIEKIILKNDIYSLNYSLYWPTKEQTGYDMHQIGNVISSDNYIYTIIYSSDNEINNDEYNNIIDSFNIKDTINSRKTSKQITIILIILIASIASTIHLVNKHKRTNK